MDIKYTKNSKYKNWTCYTFYYMLTYLRIILLADFNKSADRDGSIDGKIIIQRINGTLEITLYDHWNWKFYNLIMR